MLRRLDHAVEIRAAAVDTGKVLVIVDRVDVPAVVDGVVGQQGSLVLDALGLGLVFVLILLAQSCIDCAKDLSHLLLQYNLVGTLGSQPGGSSVSCQSYNKGSNWLTFTPLSYKAR